MRARCASCRPTSPAEIDRATAVRAAWPAVQFAGGVHPHRAGAYEARVTAAAAAVEAAAARVELVAVGEIGLDYHYDFAPPRVQQEVFASQVDLAIRRDLPVVIHTREATEDTLALLSGTGGRARGVLHCFTGTRDEARRALDLGFYISISGIVTFPRSDTVREVGAFVPDDRLLIETDAPFLAPVPHRGRRNEPAWVAETLATLARVRETPPEELGARVAENLRVLVGGEEVERVR